MTDEEMIKWIDGTSFEELLRKWRFATAGDPFFQGEIGQYYSKVMFAKRDAMKHNEAVQISKNVGWE